MDPAKRGADRLRRLYHARANDGTGRSVAGMTALSLAAPKHQTSLRRVIADEVVSFVLAVEPIEDGGVLCQHALVSITRTGVELTTLVQAESADPRAVIVGFCVNQDDPHWAVVIGELNSPVALRATSTKARAVFSMSSPSEWLKDHYEEAVAAGVTIAVHATTNLGGDLRQFVGEWEAILGRQLDPVKLFSLLDTQDDSAAYTLTDASNATSVSDAAPDDDGTLSLTGSLNWQ